jgi:hypothetical protein
MSVQRLITTNWLAVAVSVVLHFILGSAWYGVLANQWLEAVAARERGFDPQAASPAIYLTSIVSVVLATLFVAKLMDLSGERTVAGGVKWSLVLAATIGLPLLLMHYAFAGYSPALLAIDGGYELFSLVLTGVVTGALGFRGRAAVGAARLAPSAA